MVSGMLADDIDNRHLRPARVVQIGEAIAKTGAEMQQSASWFPSHARIAVRRSRDHSFEKTEHAAHLRDPVKCRNDMDFRRAGVREASINSTGDQGTNQTFGAVHLFMASGKLRFAVRQWY